MGAVCKFGSNTGRLLLHEFPSGWEQAQKSEIVFLPQVFEQYMFLFSFEVTSHTSTSHPPKKKMGVEGETKGGGSPFFAPTGEIPAEPKQSLNFVSAFSAYFIASKSAALEAKAFSRPIFVDSFFAYQTERFSCHKYIFISTYSIPET